VQEGSSPTVLSEVGRSGEPGRLVEVPLFTDELDEGEIEADDPPSFAIFVSAETSRNVTSVLRKY